MTLFVRGRRLSLFWARWVHSTPFHPIFNIHFNIILISEPRSSKGSLSFRFPLKTLMRSPFSPPPTCHTFRSSHPPNDNWWGSQIIKLLIMIYPSCLLRPPPRPICPQHPVLAHPVHVIPSVWETKFHTHTSNAAALFNGWKTRLNTIFRYVASADSNA
jgi:hypothetical protein